MIKIRESKIKSPHGIWVPAPYGAKRTAGRVVENVPAGGYTCSNVEVTGEGLQFNLGETRITLSDCIASDFWLTYATGDNRDVTLEMPKGHCSLFNNDSKTEVICESEGVSVIRVSTLLKDKESGNTLNNAAAYTDLYFWHSTPMVSVMTYFEVGDYTPTCKIDLGRIAAVGNACFTSDGEKWQTLSEEPYTAYDWHVICRDIREFDALHPFVSHIALSPCELPVPTRESVSWQGPVITSGALQVQMERTEGGLALASITDAKIGVIYDGDVPESLFRLILRRLDLEEDMILTSDCGWENVKEEMTKAGPLYRFERADLSVELAAVLVPEKSCIEWEMDVRIWDENLSAVRLDPPAFRMNMADDTMLFHSVGPGQALPLNTRSEKYFYGPYPSADRCMQYMALWSSKKQRGVYCGFHDPRGSVKRLFATCHDGICKLEAYIPSSGIDEPRNSFHMDGHVAWQIFDGDWYDAALIYKKWVHTYANWFDGIPSSERKDVPEWLLKVPVWFCTHVKPEEYGKGLIWVDDLLEARKDFKDMLVGTHLYSWHEIPFDTNYPHYKPARPVFEKYLPVLQAHDIKVMPYINGHIWDTHDRGDYDYQFSSLAKPAAAKGRNNEVVTERYLSKNSKGELVWLAAMCPSTALWQEKMMEVNTWLLQDLGVDAVYVDQVSAMRPVNCMDPTHSHRKGGGSWWHEYNSHMFDHLNRCGNSQQCYTTEANAEVYVGHIGGMLTWHWKEDHQVPAFPVVYAGYQPMFGRWYSNFEKEDTCAFRILTGQSLCFGDQLGWLEPGLYLNSPYRDFFRQLAHLRWQYGEYFYSGTCLRPPKLTGEVGEITTEKQTFTGEEGKYITETLTSPGVLSALWQKNADDSRIVVLVNITDEERTVTVSPEDAEAFEVTIAPVSAIIRQL